MSANPPELPVCRISQSATIRLVPTAYYKPPVLSPLVDTDEELGILEALEGLTNTRLRAEGAGLSALNARELAYGVWGTTYINAAFAYTRSSGNRFNDGSRGAWYCAFDDLTAIAEVAFHRTRELRYIGVFQDTAVYQGLLADFIGEMSDARDLPKATGILDPDTERAYPLGQALAHQLRTDGARGLLYPSVRKPGGICLVAFYPHIVQNVRLGPRWKIIWDGSEDYSVEGD